MWPIMRKKVQNIDFLTFFSFWVFEYDGWLCIFDRGQVLWNVNRLNSDSEVEHAGLTALQLVSPLVR